MKFYISILFVMTMCGCADESVSEPARSERDVSVPAAPDSGDYDHQTEGHVEPGLCEKYEKIVLRAGDGGTIGSVRIPLPCDPLWKMKDRGDPPFSEP